MPIPPILTPLRAIWDTLPILNLENRMGLTDYIDFLVPEDMSHSIMKGIDAYRRPFVAFKVRAVRASEGPSGSTGSSLHVCTFFQRYSDDTESWAYGCTFGNFGTFYHDSRLRVIDYPLIEARLTSLLAGLPVTGFNNPDEELYLHE